MPGADVSTRQRYVLWVALVLVAVLSSLSSVISPLFEPPDELQHYQFVRYLVDQRELPVQELDGEISQSHQPPLYYVIGALLVAGIEPRRKLEKNYTELP